MSKTSRKAKLRRVLWEETNGHCVYCDTVIPIHLRTSDHIWPKSRGGNEVLYNLVPSCGPCNAARGTTFPASKVAHARWVQYVKNKEIDVGIAIPASLKSPPLSCWWVEYLHEKETKTVVNPDGTRVAFLQCAESTPIAEELDAFEARVGSKGIISMGLHHYIKVSPPNSDLDIPSLSSRNP